MKKGLTVIELLIALAIIVILLVVTIIPFASFRNKQLLDSTTQEIVSLINEARSRTLAGEGDSNYGLRFESSQVTLFKGSTWPGYNAPDNKEIIFNDRLEIGAINLTGGGVHVIFNRLTGTTAQNGLIRLQLKADTDSYRQVVVQPSGLVAVQ